MAIKVGTDEYTVYTARPAAPDAGFVEAYEKEEARMAQHDSMGFTVFVNGADKVGNVAAWLARMGYKFECEADPDQIAEWRIMFVADMLAVVTELCYFVREHDVDVMMSRPERP